MLRISLLPILALLICLASISSRGGGEIASPDASVRFVLPQRLELSGELAERISLTLRRMLSEMPYSDSLVLEDVARRPHYDRRFEEYEGDVSGRYIGALAAIGRLTGMRYPKLERIARATLEYQSSQGFFGQNQEPQGWEEWRKQLWGHGRLLSGLAEYYRYSGDPQVFSAAQRLARYLADSIPRWPLEKSKHPWFTDFTSLLESFMILYEIDPREEWLDAAKKIAPLVPKFGKYHAHGFLISRVGLAKLAQATGDAAIVDSLAMEIHEILLPKAVLPDGGMVEWLPQNERTEGCAIVDWLRLLLQMWELTGSTEYLDEAERTWLNSLYFHQTANGAFGHARVTSYGYEASYSEAWWCCLPHGLLGLVEVARHAVAKDTRGLYVNFFTSMRWKTDIKGVTVEVRIRTDFPRSDTVQVQLTSSRRVAFELRVRLAKWTENCTVFLNRERIQPVAAGGYLRLNRTWEGSKQLTFVFPQTLRKVKISALPSTLPGLSTPYLILYHGPLLLVADLRHNRSLEGTLAPDCFEFLQRVRDSTSATPFGIPSAHFKTRCQDGVTLTPISEQTGFGKWTEDLQGFVLTGEKPIHRVPVRWCWQISS